LTWEEVKNSEQTAGFTVRYSKKFFLLQNLQEALTRCEIKNFREYSLEWREKL